MKVSSIFSTLLFALTVVAHPAPHQEDCGDSCDHNNHHEDPCYHPHPHPCEPPKGCHCPDHCPQPPQDLPEELPYLTLGEITPFPNDLLQGLAAAAAPGSSLRNLENEQGVFYYDGSRLTAHYNKLSGETAVYPRLSSLTGAKPARPANDTISKYLNDGRIFPEDDTILVQVPGQSLSGSSKGRNGTASETLTYLTEVLVQRNITHQDFQFPVCGLGTKASFRVGSDGTIRSVSHRWRPATKSSNTLRTISKDQALTNIAAQLSDVRMNATVEDISLCYYDAGEFLQPAWRYWLAQPDQDQNVTNSRLVGYIAAAEGLPEELPKLIPDPACPAALPPYNTTQANGNLARRSFFDDILGGIADDVGSDLIRVGRYIQQNNFASGSFRDDSNKFMSQLTFWAGFENSWPFNWFNPGFRPLNFVDSQSAEGATPVIYEKVESDFLDQVDLALTIGHGNYHIFATNGTCDSSVDSTCAIASIDNMSNFGQNLLRYWAMKGCSIIPTPQDFYCPEDQHQAWDTWWDMFNGLHAAVGLRTDGWVSDGVPEAFGAKVAIGVSVIDAWLSTCHDTAHYSGTDYYWWRTNGDQLWKKDPHGQPSAVTVCGHGDDTIREREKLDPPSCLQMFWWGDTVWSQDCDLTTATVNDGEWQVDESTCKSVDANFCTPVAPPH
ncbi:hypothetical protein K432DRAFT_444791 [Lepidopterella palustris CBS 459.81]|uniref:Uncharacterized protein n=1 Tax=Lepidopterella palustris CBS 459.81 TaxID=1314670 RepID=A0A8E2E6R9_9PEZI|nr:hypothetical protein K432DRAFT_444791 [Lepidopterella palustris CBS 459.81]